LIANDVEPVELVVFLPTLCKAMDIPYAIVQNKARLGRLVHKKSAAVVCLTDFKEHQTELANITRVCRDNFNNVVQTFKKPEKGIKSQIRERQLQKILQAEAAKKMINDIANPHIPEVGERFNGKVVKLATFGAFISLVPGKDGLLHISQIRKMHGGKRIENLEDVMKVGDEIEVEIGEIDPKGKFSLVPVLPEGAASEE